MLGELVWQSRRKFFVKKLSSKEFSCENQLHCNWIPQGWITIRPTEIQIPTTSDATDTELPGAFLAAAAEAAEAAGVGGLVTVSTALEDVYLVKQYTPNSKSQGVQTLYITVYNSSNIFTPARLVQTHHMTKHYPAKTGEYPRIFPIFKSVRVANKHNSLHWTWNMDWCVTETKNPCCGKEIGPKGVLSVATVISLAALSLSPWMWSLD